MLKEFTSYTEGLNDDLDLPSANLLYIFELKIAFASC